LRADVCVVHDTGQFAKGVPAITYGLRGLCYQEVVLTGVKSDLHSGMFGGAVPNAGNELAKIIAGLHDGDRRVTIPGFYDDVIPLTDEERAQWKTLPFDEADFAASVGIEKPVGEAGYTALEQRWARPTLDVNGLTSGYQGEGAKTVIPSKASAKISMRLVPGQKWTTIREKFQQTIRDRCPAHCSVEFIDHGGIDAGLLPIDTPAAKLAAEAVKIGFDADPVFIREGGSIPVGSLFKEILDLDSLFVGFGLPDDNLHAPNEKMDLDSFYHGARTAAALYDKLSKLEIGRG
ncbi:MAG: M20/M25/M40 family metallo-hydrolase, partial [Planctomycetota bacterium]